MDDVFIKKHAIFMKTIEELGLTERGGVKRICDLLGVSKSQVEKMKNINRECMPDTTLNYLLLLNEVRKSNPKLYKKAMVPGGLLAERMIKKSQISMLTVPGGLLAERSAMKKKGGDRE